MESLWPYRSALLMVLSCYLIFLTFWALGELWNRLLPARRCNPWLVPAVLSTLSVGGGMDFYLRMGGDLSVVIATLPVLVTCATSAHTWKQRQASQTTVGISR